MFDFLTNWILYPAGKNLFKGRKIALEQRSYFAQVFAGYVEYGTGLWRVSYKSNLFPRVSFRNFNGEELLPL